MTDVLTGFPFSSSGYVADDDAPRLLRGDNVAQGVLRWDGAKRWSSDSLDDLEAYWLRRSDVILAMDRPWIDAGLKYASVRESDLPSLLVQRVARLRGTPRLDTTFLKYVIGGREFTDHVLACQTGTAVPHISPGQIKSFEFQLPPLPEQRAIARILGALDDKIELNRRTNETLEAMARALFKSWFVDFDPVRAKDEGRETELPPRLASLIPDQFVETAHGQIPLGWDSIGLDRLATFLNGLALQKYPATGPDSLPVIKIAQLRAGHSAGADRCSTDVPPEYVVRDGDVLFSWSGSLEVEVWCGGPGALNQHLFKVTSGAQPKWLYFAWTRHHLADFREIAADKATTMGHIQRRHLAEARCLVPAPALIQALTPMFASLLDRRIACATESRTLAALRDALLPKLLSGELRVPDAERLVEART